MEQNQRRRIGLPLTVLIVGLLLLLLGMALTLLNGELKRRTQLDAAGLQATLNGVKAAYLEAGAKLAEGENAAQSDAATYAQLLYDEQLNTLIAQVAPEQEALVRFVIRVLPYVPYRFPLLAAGGVLTLMGTVWLAVRIRAARKAGQAASVRTLQPMESGEHRSRVQPTLPTETHTSQRMLESQSQPASAPAPAYCSGCGARLRQGAHFCGSCGRHVGR